MHKILIVDDETDILDLVAINLEREGLEIAAAHDGIEAVEVAKKELPDLVVLGSDAAGKGWLSSFQGTASRPTHHAHSGDHADCQGRT